MLSKLFFMKNRVEVTILLMVILLMAFMKWIEIRKFLNSDAVIKRVVAYNIRDETLPLTLDKRGPATKSYPGPPVHFLETKIGKRYLTLREACAIESAARHHPNSLVIIHTIDGGFDWSNHNVYILKTFSNIRISLLNLTDLFSETPLMEWHKNNTIATSRFPAQHMSDACRYVILYKYGGIYLDTDSVVVNTLEYFKNSIGIEAYSVLAISVLVFDKGHPFMANCIYDFAMNYHAKSYAGNGPRLTTRVLLKMCHVNNSFEDVMNKPEMCQGVSVLPRVNILPYSHKDMFRAKKDNELDFSDKYVVHLWSNITRQIQSKLGSNSIIENVFRMACPSVFQKILKVKNF